MPAAPRGSSSLIRVLGGAAATTGDAAVFVFPEAGVAGFAVGFATGSVTEWSAGVIGRIGAAAIVLFFLLVLAVVLLLFRDVFRGLLTDVAGEFLLLLSGIPA